MDITKGTKVFVTGGNGFVGSWLVKDLLGRGAVVTCLIKEDIPGSIFSIENLASRVTVVPGKLEDRGLIEQTIKNGDFEIVFHLAAQAIVGIANKEPRTTFETNIMGTWHLMEACRLNPGIKAIVVSSSDKAYGDSLELPYKEDSALRGIHPYDVSKSCEDLISSTYYHSYNLPVGIVRCGNIYGGGDVQSSRIIPGVSLWLIRGETIVIRSDGKFIRDYVYVEDVVSAYIAVAISVSDGKFHGEAWNVSNDSPVSVLEVVEQLVLVSGKSNPEIKILNEASNEIRDQYLSSQKIREKLLWKPVFDLDSGLKKTYSWYEGHSK